MLTKADKTRQFIIEKSAPIFNTKGYAGTSMSDIMEATGLAKGGIYGNFTSKDEIAAEAFEYSYNKVREALRFKIKQEPTAKSKLFGILAFYKNFTITPFIAGGCPVLNTAIEADDNVPFLKQKSKTAMQEMLASICSIIEKGQEHYEFKQSIDAVKEAEMIYAQIEGGIMMAKLADEPGILNRILDTIKKDIENRFVK